MEGRKVKRRYSADLRWRTSIFDPTCLSGMLSTTSNPILLNRSLDPDFSLQCVALSDLGSSKCSGRRKVPVEQKFQSSQVITPAKKIDRQLRSFLPLSSTTMLLVPESESVGNSLM